MEPPLNSAWIIEQGLAVGFDKAGIAPAGDFEELLSLPRWLERGFAGEMEYLRNPKRGDVRQLLPEARSVLCFTLNYDTALPRSTETSQEPTRGWISRYAWGTDYHELIRSMLEEVESRIASRAGDGFRCKIYVDTGPVLERVYAHYAGLGWQGKNTCLIDPELGSFYFLGLLVTNLDLEPGQPPADQCGACTLCLEACPTQALVEPHVLDARRCVSYLTIELRGPIPESLRQPMGRHLFGCDICQDVCPYNQNVARTRRVDFQPRTVEGKPLFHVPLEHLASLPEDKFAEAFRGSPIKRAKWRGLMRNTLVAMGNSGNRAFRSMLEKFASGSDAVLAEHAQWALNRLHSSPDPE